ncbi:gastrula zinc finger protein XlCGF52.1-like [Phyllopteryx taeniolatus]|uniref:gastrula zinc finger protein XlCGF52.1-like n=1 Tax=Phyllopteryx taeniolatus TaxID=161469 RepID=UPI002AD4D194|nr:gastrula zinc finger protein XlCGF52.1-like [Phyllopteryx taeniolatus]
MGSQYTALPPDVLKVIVVKEERQEWSSGTEEEEEPRAALVRDEENELREADRNDVSSTGVPVKSEDGEPDTSLRTSRAERDGGSETDPRLDPLSSPSSETDDSDETNELLASGEARRHAGEKRFSCSECDKTFDHKRNLKRHMRRHTGEKPFCCPVCSKTFRQRSNLVVHSRTHTGVKPFSCSLCDTSFSQRISLVLHVRTHTGEKPFPCSVCGERFSRKGTVMSHMRRHTGEKPFSCAACAKRFAFKCQISTSCVLPVRIQMNSSAPDLNDVRTFRRCDWLVRASRVGLA